MPHCIKGLREFRAVPYRGRQNIPGRLLGAMVIT